MSFGIQKRKNDPNLARTQSLAAGTWLGTSVAIGGGIFMLLALSGHAVLGFFAALLGAPIYMSFSSIFGWYYAKEKVGRDVATEGAIARAKAAAQDAANAAQQAWQAARAAGEQASSIAMNAAAAKEPCRRAAQAAIDAERAAQAAGEHANAAHQGADAAGRGGDQAQGAANYAIGAAQAARASADEANRQYAIAGQAVVEARQAIAEEGEDRAFILKRLVQANNFIGFLEGGADQNRRDEIKQNVSGQLLDIVIRLQQPNVVHLLRSDEAIRNLLSAVSERLARHQLDIPHAAIILDAAAMPHR